MTSSILEVQNLKKYYELKTGISRTKIGEVHAVDDVSFKVGKGETLGLVGESGCGKTTLALTILRLVQHTSGNVFFKNQNIFNFNRTELRQLRRKMQIVFQDPFASLNPRMTVSDLVGEGLDIHNLGDVSKKRDMIARLIEEVGLSPDHLHRYPHEFSGGQRQRIGIARALILKPELLIADEPVSSIDVSVRAQILNLLRDLKENFDLTLILISHDLTIVKYLCDRAAVMYLGKIVELGETKEIFENPQHPYTAALLSAIPIPDPRVKRERIILKGDVPTPIDPPPGCRFFPRCSVSKPICKNVDPKLLGASGKREHLVACHH